jgi:hypothetical protein
MLRSASILILMAAALLAACSDDSTGTAPDGTYTAAVEGSFTAVLSGPAYFGTGVDDDGGAYLAIVLGDEDAEHVIGIARPGTTLPSIGSYDLDLGSETGFGALHVVSNGDELLAIFIASSGTLTITESSSRRLKGTFEYIAEPLFADPEEEAEEVTVEGSFDAEWIPAAVSAVQSRVAVP